MHNQEEAEIIELKEDVSHSPLYSEDLAPVPKEKRTWTTWNLVAIWVGMAVCIPTYMMAAEMIKDGISWWAALGIIGLGNLIITVPMILNGHAGVKYGIPFPVLGRASFGHNGIHIASVVRALVACGWFGIQTWLGGLAIYAIWNVITGSEPSMGLGAGQFICFGLFWLVNMFFVWRGTESIRWLEEYSAPILILMGLLLIAWGAIQAGGFGKVLEQSKQLERPTAILTPTETVNGNVLTIEPLVNKDGTVKATEYQLFNTVSKTESGWLKLTEGETAMQVPSSLTPANLANTKIQMRAPNGKDFYYSSKTGISLSTANSGSRFWKYLLLLTAMVGFWATMSLSIADITRYAASQKSQIAGQFIGLPGTMILYSFVGIFVTCAALINFQDILIGEDAPWDPVNLLSKFSNPLVVIIAQIFMLIATLSTNIAANVIAPANAFSNIAPKRISFRTGGIITGVLGILTMPWWSISKIIPLLLIVSGLLGPVLGILLSDYYLIRKKRLDLDDLFKTDGVYSYASGFNPVAMLALVLGILGALIGYLIPYLAQLNNLSWFTGFFIAFFLYTALMWGKRTKIA